MSTKKKIVITVLLGLLVALGIYLLIEDIMMIVFFATPVNSEVFYSTYENKFAYFNFIIKQPFLNGNIELGWFLIISRLMFHFICILFIIWFILKIWGKDPLPKIQYSFEEYKSNKKKVKTEKANKKIKVLEKRIDDIKKDL